MPAVRLLQGLTIGGTIHPAGSIIEVPPHDICQFADGAGHYCLSGRVAEWVDQSSSAAASPKKAKSAPPPPQTEPESLEDGKETSIETL